MFVGQPICHPSLKDLAFAESDNCSSLPVAPSCSRSLPVKNGSLHAPERTGCWNGRIVIDRRGLIGKQLGGGVWLRELPSESFPAEWSLSRRSSEYGVSESCEVLFCVNWRTRAIDSGWQLPVGHFRSLLLYPKQFLGTLATQRSLVGSLSLQVPFTPLRTLLHQILLCLASFSVPI